MWADLPRRACARKSHTDKASGCVHLGISGIEGLELGEDGTEDGPKLSWLLDKETCYMGSDYKLQICKFDSVFDAGF